MGCGASHDPHVPTTVARPTAAEIVEITQDGFSRKHVQVVVGQTVQFRWGQAPASPGSGHNIVQITPAQGRWVPMFGGFTTGSRVPSGSATTQFYAPGEYFFMSNGLRGQHVVVAVGLVGPTIIQVNDQGFWPSQVNIMRDESVEWRWSKCNGKHAIVPASGSSASNQTPSVTGTCCIPFSTHGACRFISPGLDSSNVCTVAVSHAPKWHVVQLRGSSQFLPQVVTIKQGDSVVWVWEPSADTKERRVVQVRLHPSGDHFGVVNDGIACSYDLDHPRSQAMHTFSTPGTFWFQSHTGSPKDTFTVVVEPMGKKHVFTVEEPVTPISAKKINQGDMVHWRPATEEHGAVPDIFLEESPPVYASLNGVAPPQPQSAERAKQVLCSPVHTFDRVGMYLTKPRSFRSEKADFHTCIAVKQAPQTHTVRLLDNRFEPETLEVRVDDLVTWKWLGAKRPQGIGQLSQKSDNVPNGFGTGKVRTKTGAYTWVPKVPGTFFFFSSGFTKPVVGIVRVVPKQSMQFYRFRSETGHVARPIRLCRNDLLCVGTPDDARSAQDFCIEECNIRGEALRSPRSPSADLTHSASNTKPLCLKFSQPGAYFLRSQDDSVLSILVDEPKDIVRIRVTAQGFVPKQVVVAPGQTVSWYWKDELHRIVEVVQDFKREPYNAFNSGTEKELNGDFSITFTLPGDVYVASDGTNSGGPKYGCHVRVVDKPAQAATPVMTLHQDAVHLSSVTDAATIYYTLDGTRATCDNPVAMVYDPTSSPSLAGKRAFVRAVAYAEDHVCSNEFVSELLTFDAHEVDGVRQEVADEWQTWSPLVVAQTQWPEPPSIQLAPVPHALAELVGETVFEANGKRVEVSDPAAIAKLFPKGSTAPVQFVATVSPTPLGQQHGLTARISPPKTIACPGSAMSKGKQASSAAKTKQKVKQEVKAPPPKTDPDPKPQPDPEPRPEPQQPPISEPLPEQEPAAKTEPNPETVAEEEQQKEAPPRLLDGATLLDQWLQAHGSAEERAAFLQEAEILDKDGTGTLTREQLTVVLQKRPPFTEQKKAAAIMASHVAAADEANGKTCSAVHYYPLSCGLSQPNPDGERTEHEQWCQTSPLAAECVRRWLASVQCDSVSAFCVALRPDDADCSGKVTKDALVAALHRLGTTETPPDSFWHHPLVSRTDEAGRVSYFPLARLLALCHAQNSLVPVPSAESVDVSLFGIVVQWRLTLSEAILLEAERTHVFINGTPVPSDAHTVHRVDEQGLRYALLPLECLGACEVVEFAIEACLTDGQGSNRISVLSPVLSASVPLTPPSLQLCVTKITSGGVQLAWESEGVTAVLFDSTVLKFDYQVLRDNNTIDEIGHDVTDYTATMLDPLAKYRFQVKAISRSDPVLEVQSNWLEVVYEARPSPPALTLDNAIVSEDSVELKWEEPTDAVGMAVVAYRVSVQGELNGTDITVTLQGDPVSPEVMRLLDSQREHTKPSENGTHADSSDAAKAETPGVDQQQQQDDKAVEHAKPHENGEVHLNGGEQGEDSSLGGTAPKVSTTDALLLPSQDKALPSVSAVGRAQLVVATPYICIDKCLNKATYSVSVVVLTDRTGAMHESDESDWVDVSFQGRLAPPIISTVSADAYNTTVLWSLEEGQDEATDYTVTVKDDAGHEIAKTVPGSERETKLKHHTSFKPGDVLTATVVAKAIGRDSQPAEAKQATIPSASVSAPQLKLERVDVKGILVTWDACSQQASGGAEVVGHQVMVNGESYGGDDERLDASATQVLVTGQRDASVCTICIVRHGEVPEADGHTKRAVWSPSAPLVVPLGKKPETPELSLKSATPNSLVVGWGKDAHQPSTSFVVRWWRAPANLRIPPANYQETRSVPPHTVDSLMDHGEPLGSDTCRPGSTQYTVQGLDSLASYVILVEAVVGAFVERSNGLVAVTHGPPAAPTLSVLQSQSSSLLVGWSEPEIHGVDVSGFTLEYVADSLDDGAVQTKQIPPNERSFQIQGLQPKTRVRITCFARTGRADVGDSPQSNTLEAYTSGVECPQLRVQSRLESAIVLEWTPAKLYGQRRELGNVFVQWCKGSGHSVHFELDEWQRSEPLPSESTRYVVDLPESKGEKYRFFVEYEVDRMDPVRSEIVVSSTVSTPTPPAAYIAALREESVVLEWQPSAATAKSPKLQGYMLEVNGRRYGTEHPVDCSRVEVSFKDIREYFGGEVNTDVGAEINLGVVAVTAEPDVYVSSPVQRVRVPGQQQGLVTVRYDPGIVNSTTNEEDQDEDTQAAPGAVVVSWSQLDEEDDVAIEWTTHRSAVVQRASCPAGSKEFCIFNVLPATIYHVVVSTEISSQKCSTVSAIVPGAPEAPQVWLKAVSGQEIRIGWSQPRLYGFPLSHFNLRIDGKTLPRTLPANNLVASLPCKPSRTHCIEVVAVAVAPANGALYESRPSAPLVVQTPGSLLAVYGVSPSANTITLDWAEKSSADIHPRHQYGVEWSSVKSPTVLRAICKEQTYQIQGCAPGDKYFIVVKALDDKKRVLLKSDQVVVQTPKEPDAPVLRLSSATSAMIEVEWDTPHHFGNAKIDAIEIVAQAKKDKAAAKASRRSAHVLAAANKESVALDHIDQLLGDEELAQQVWEQQVDLNRNGTAELVELQSFVTRQYPVFDEAVAVQRALRLTLDQQGHGSSGRLVKRDLPVFLRNLYFANKLLQVFHTIDSDDNHVIDMAEFRAALQSPDASKALDLAEFRAALGAIVPNTETDFAESQFQAMDADKSGRVSFAEFSSWAAVHLWEMERTKTTEQSQQPGFSQVLAADCTRWQFTDCKPCTEYEFRARATCSHVVGNGAWSEPLTVVCPGARGAVPVRATSSSETAIRVRLQPPRIYGVDPGQLVGQELQWKQTAHPMDSLETNLLGPDETEYEISNLERGVDYAIRVCPQFDGVRAEPSANLIAQTARPPQAPYIQAVIQVADKRREKIRLVKSLLQDRETASRRLKKLEHKRPTSHAKEHAHSSDANQAEEHIIETEKRISTLLRDLHGQTNKTYAVDVSWTAPVDDGDAVVSSFLVFVDNAIVKQVPATQHHVIIEVDISKDRNVSVIAVSEHAVGPSSKSNSVLLSASQFEPFVFRCRVDAHREEAVPPQSGCCAYIDTFMQDIAAASAFPYQLKLNKHGAQAETAPLGRGDAVPSVTAYSVLDDQPVDMAQPASLLVCWTHWCKASKALLPNLHTLCRKLQSFASKGFKVVTFSEGTSAEVVQDALSAASADWPACVQHTFEEPARAQEILQQLSVTHVPELLLVTRKGKVAWRGLMVSQSYADFEEAVLHKVERVFGLACERPDCKTCNGVAVTAPEPKKTNSAVTNPYGAQPKLPALPKRKGTRPKAPAKR